MHGKDGEDGVAQSYFEYLKIPYTHSGVLSSYNAMNKIISKEMFIQNGIKTPKYFSAMKKNFKKTVIQKKKAKKICYPIVIKPINEGSSLGVEICKNSIQLFKKAKNYLKLMRI